MHDLIHHTRKDGTPYPVEECRIYQAFREGKPTDIDDEVLWRADGSGFPAEYRSNPIWQDGNLVGSVVTFFDITDRKKAEEALRESEEKFRSLTQSASDAIISADSTGKITSWNNGARQIFGYKEDEVVGKPLTILMPERYKDAHQKGADRFVSTGETKVIGKTVELEGLRKDGAQFPIELSISSWKTEKGIFFSAIIRDITKRKEVEETLKEAQKSSRAWLECSPVCTKKVDLDFNLQYMSNAGVLGLKIDDITQYYGKPYPFHFYPDSFKAPMSKNLKKVKETGGIIEQEAFVLDTEGH
jgi:PAS domain S-box-containing protein